jgi:excisionase family DNA binding protein
MEKEYYSPEEAASLLGVTRRTIYTWLKTGKLPARQFGRTWRIHRSEVQPPQRKEAA